MNNIVEKMTFALGVNRVCLSKQLSISVILLRRYPDINKKSKTIFEKKVAQFLKDNNLTEEKLDEIIEEKCRKNIIFYINKKLNKTNEEIAEEINLSSSLFISHYAGKKIPYKYLSTFKEYFEKYNLDFQPFEDKFMSEPFTSQVRIVHDYLPFEQARAFMHSVNLENTKEWKQWLKGKLYGKVQKPDFIPSKPQLHYAKTGWTNWSDWLGTSKEIEFMPFEEAREFVRSLKLKTPREWQKLYQQKQNNIKLPKEIPWNPQVVYKDKWCGMKDWLGIQRYLSFEEARSFVRSLGIGGQVEWKQYCRGELPGFDKKPDNIPSSPLVVYKDQWVSTADWLGSHNFKKARNEEISNVWLPYEEAKQFVNSLKLKQQADWAKYLKGEFKDLPPLPYNIPRSPVFVYKNNGWTDWVSWLAIEFPIKKRRYFEDLNNIIKSLNMTKIEFANNLNMTPSILSSWAKNKRIPTKSLLRIKNLFIEQGKETVVVDALIKEERLRDYSLEKNKLTKKSQRLKFSFLL